MKRSDIELNFTIIVLAGTIIVKRLGFILGLVGDLEMKLGVSKIPLNPCAEMNEIF